SARDNRSWPAHTPPNTHEHRPTAARATPGARSPQPKDHHQACRTHPEEPPAEPQHRSRRPPPRPYATVEGGHGCNECVLKGTRPQVRQTSQGCYQGVSEGGLDPPRPYRPLAPKASASAIPPLGPAAAAGREGKGYPIEGAQPN